MFASGKCSSCPEWPSFSSLSGLWLLPSLGAMFPCEPVLVEGLLAFPTRQFAFELRKALVGSARRLPRLVVHLGDRTGAVRLRSGVAAPVPRNSDRIGMLIRQCLPTRER